MKTRNFLKTLFLLALMVVAGMFLSCEKQEDPTQEAPKTPVASVTTSDVDIQGTWECISPTWGEEYSLSVIFHSNNTYEVEAYYPSEQVSFFQSGERGNYIINDNLFYMWHVTRWANFTVVPFPEELPPMFDVSLQDDTLTLTSKYAQITYSGPSVPPRTYIFRKR